LFSKEGAIVFAVDIKGLEWITKENKLEGKIIPISLDICDFAAVNSAVMGIKNEYGHIDALANIAGFISYELMPMINYGFFHKMIEVNVVALIYLMTIVSRIMQRQK